MSEAIIETEEILIIETPERVQLAFSLASIGNRFLAVAIDHAIQYVIMIIVTVVFISSTSGFSALVEFGGNEFSKWTIAVLILLIFLIFTGYFVFFEWLWNGQTPGKRLMKLRVLREDGRPITFWEALARNLLRLFDAVPGVVIPVYSLGLISIFMSNRDQRIGDLFAGTVVVRERTDEAPTFKETFSNPVSDAAFRRVNQPVDFQANIAEITQYEIEVAENFLRRRWDLTEKQRLWMAWRVALPMMYKLKPVFEMEGFTYEGFLEELVHRYYARQRLIQ
ncbi:MAG: RDD family protein [Pyrinomonadaceae bacterium]|nr:RDD family protein [Pyrinomonadaceae bacterium]